MGEPEGVQRSKRGQEVRRRPRRDVSRQRTASGTKEGPERPASKRLHRDEEELRAARRLGGEDRRRILLPPRAERESQARETGNVGRGVSRSPCSPRRVEPNAHLLQHVDLVVKPVARRLSASAVGGLANHDFQNDIQ